MGWFKRESHDVEVQDCGFATFNFTCTCGAHSRSGRSKDEAATKARLHQQAAKRR